MRPPSIKKPNNSSYSNAYVDSFGKNLRVLICTRKPKPVDFYEILLKFKEKLAHWQTLCINRADRVTLLNLSLLAFEYTTCKYWIKLRELLKFPVE